MKNIFNWLFLFPLITSCLVSSSISLIYSMNFRAEVREFAQDVDALSFPSIDFDFNIESFDLRAGVEPFDLQVELEKLECEQVDKKAEIERLDKEFETLKKELFIAETKLRVDSAFADQIK